MKLSPHEIAWLVIQKWSDPQQQRIAVAVCLAESGGDTDVMHRSVVEDDNLGQWDHGLWQISGRWHGLKLVANPDWRDPIVAVDLARQVWEERKAAGKAPWGAWSVFNSKSYEKFLPDADFGLAAPIPPPPKPMTVEEAMALNQDLHTDLVNIAVPLSELRRHFS